MWFAEFLEKIDGQDATYCIECYSKDELYECQEILDANGWNSHAPSDDPWGKRSPECITLWVCGDNKDRVGWNPSTYDGYNAWYRRMYGTDDPDNISGVIHFSDFCEKLPEQVDDEAFCTFLSEMG